MDPRRRLVSVQVGKPRSIPQGDRAVRTAIYKEPVLFRVRVRRLNLDGDSQADLRVHGGPDKAVYAYDLSGYEHFRRLLSTGLPFGQFGENLTVEGMPESLVRIGDIYRIGSALLQVSQPRSPCYKLSLRMGRPDFGKDFVASGHPGFYLRVLEEGELGAGDSIELVESGPDRATVERVADRLFHRG
ncbi:MAG TPA: MOSC domain-containing protein [Thermoanaerobaculia bacterium]|jgi:MOSC domain-containing protein YiiM